MQIHGVVQAANNTIGKNPIIYVSGNTTQCVNTHSKFRYSFILVEPTRSAQDMQATFTESMVA